MSQTDEKETKEAPEQSEAQRTESVPDHLFIVPFPKVVFLYPTLILALISAIWMTVLERTGSAVEGKSVVLIAALFLCTLAINLFVLTVDFPRATSLTLFFVIATTGLGIVLVSILQPDLLPVFRSLIVSIQPVANATFYWLVTVILTVIFIMVKVKIQFNYWEVRRNELLHHHGVLSDLRRYPTAGLQIEKEINDVFEYMLLRSGRLILRPPGETRAFVLDNVPAINSKEEKITKMLSAIKVKVHTES